MPKQIEISSVIVFLFQSFKLRFVVFMAYWVVHSHIPGSVPSNTPGPDTKFMSSGQIGSFLVISFFLVLMILSICFVMDNSSSDSLKLLHFEIYTYRRPHKSLKKTMSFCRQVWNVCDILQLHTINTVDDHGIMWYSLILRICALSLLPR